MSSKRLSRAFVFLCGAGVGALTIYALDPTSGRRRRARWRDQGKKVLHSVSESCARRARDVYHRARGQVAETLRTLKPIGPVDDLTLKQRIRSELGHRVSHPRAVQVEVSQGRAVLRGSILSEELEETLDCVCNVPGVKSVREELAVYDRTDGGTRH